MMKKLLIMSITILVAVGFLIIGFKWGYGNNTDLTKKSNENILPIKFQSKQKINLFFTNKDNSKILSISSLFAVSIIMGILENSLIF